VNELRLSPSRINDFQNCPQLYKYRTIDKLPEKPSLEAERGTLIHTVLEGLFDSPLGDRSLALATSALPSAWAAQVDAKPEIASLVENEKEFFDRANALLVNYFALENPNSFQPTHREIHLESNLSPEFYLHGYVDRLDIAPTGEVRIVDYKTGKAPKPGWEEKALFQLRVYALLYWRLEGVVAKLLQLIYLGDQKTVKSSPSEAELLATEKTLLRIGNDISEAIDMDRFNPKPSRLCDWCSFKPICPAHN
jgi:putative RecB family exonuclease